MAEYYLTAPLKEADVRKLAIGDFVYISGRAFTCRSRLQCYVFDELHTLPFKTDDENVLIHAGPIVLPEKDSWKLISFMPTSSIRFEKWGASSVDEWKLRLIVGKTTMGQKTMDMMKEKGCVHVSPQCVSPNLWLDSIKILGVDLFDELGTIEAAWRLELDKLGPFVVDIDSNGNNLFDTLQDAIHVNKLDAFKKLGIPADFEYTKLY